jgi:hypothetical protein
MSIWKGYAYAWITLGLFVFSLAGHWLFGWFTFVSEQTAHGQPTLVADYTNEMLRDTFENWQSEFLQLLWQVGGLAFFLFLGSPQSKEESDRTEAKLDAILRAVDQVKGNETIEEIDALYGGRETDPGVTKDKAGSSD